MEWKTLFQNIGTTIYSPRYTPDSIRTRYIQKILSICSKFAWHVYHVKESSEGWDWVPRYLQMKYESLWSYKWDGPMHADLWALLDMLGQGQMNGTSTGLARGHGEGSKRWQTNHRSWSTAAGNRHSLQHQYAAFHSSCTTVGSLRMSLYVHLQINLILQKWPIWELSLTSKMWPI